MNNVEHSVCVLLTQQPKEEVSTLCQHMFFLDLVVLASGHSWGRKLSIHTREDFSHNYYNIAE